MPNKKGRFSPQEKVFVERMAATGDAVYAATKAGYGSPQPRASENLQKPAVVDAIRRQQVARLNNELLPLAIDTLLDVMTAKNSTERGRLAAAAHVLKHTVGANIEASEGKEPHEMSADELHLRIEALRREAAERAKPIIDAKPVESDVFG